MTHLATPGDTIRITVGDVTLLDSSMTRNPVTNGLTGTITLLNWESGATAVAATPIQLHADDDWYVDITAPVAGRYRIVATIFAAGTQRTLAGELKVGDPST